MSPRGKKVEKENLMATVFPKPLAGPGAVQKVKTIEEDLFPESEKDRVIFTLERYEKATNSEIERTYQAIAKKREELESLQAGLMRIREAKKIVMAQEFQEAKVSEKEAVGALHL